MTPEIKQRIAQIQRGEVPEGYKRVGHSVIPKSWKKVNFGKVATVRLGLVSPKEEPYLSMYHIGPDNIEKDTGRINGVKTAAELGLISGKFYFDTSSIVYSKIRPNLNKICAPDFEGICSADCYSIQPNKGMDKIYLLNLMLSHEFYKRAVACSMRTGMPKINQDDLNVIPLIVSDDIKEQQKIAAILTTQDKIIELKEKLLTEKQHQKKYLMQQLLTGKKRLPGFSGEWGKIKIGCFIREIDERSTVNNQYEILSVTKNGIVPQSSHFNKQIASENNIGYKVLRKGMLAFSTMNLWMGSLDILTICEVGIISPAYKVFALNTNVITVDFAKNFMKSAKMCWLYKINSEQGASIVRRNLDLQSLLNSKVALPKIPEQIAIATVISTIDREIELLQQDIEQEKQKKKALMQLLLTGIVRVKA